MDAATGTSPMPDDKDRLEREINEILDKIEQFPTPERRRNRTIRRHLRRVGDVVSARQRAIARELSRVSLSQLLLLGVLLILGSFFFRGFGLGQWVLFAGVALLVASGALLLFGGGKGPGERTQQWRGRTISYSSETLAARIRRWFGSRKPR